MRPHSIATLIPILQVAVGPVILISGVGLLLLSMTNRYGRTIDRSRILMQELRSAPADALARINAQLDVLVHRSRVQRVAIFLGAFSVLLAATLIVVLFLLTLLDIDLPSVLIAIFVACLLSLIGSLVAFIRDIDLSLAALATELRDRG